MAKRKKTRAISGPLIDRIPFYLFATKLLGINSEQHKVKLTPGQSAIWKSYDRQIAMTSDEADAYRGMTDREPWVVGSKPPPYALYALHRGAGKTMLAGAVALYEALTSPYEAMAGEDVSVIVVAPRVSQAKRIIGYATGLCQLPTIAPFVESVVDAEIRVKGGRKIQVAAADQGGTAARGVTALALIIDEAAFLSAAEDEDVFESASSSGRGVRTFRCLLTSSVNGKTGLFWNVYSANHGNDSEVWETYLGSAEHVYPDVLLDPDAIRKKAENPDGYRREYLCDFDAGSGTSTYFDTNKAKECINDGVTEIPPQRGGQYVCAVDPSGGAHDTMTCTIIERMESGEIRQCLIRGWDPQAGSVVVHDIAQEIAGIIAPYGISVVYGDVFGGQWCSEAFLAAGITYETRGFNGGQKVQRARLLSELFGSQRIQLLDHPQQYKEIREYEKKTLASGQISVNHPNTIDGSDDYLDALALATWELVGNDVKLHPPAQLRAYNANTYNRDMWENGSRPSIHGRGPVLSYDEIASGGQGPRWMVANWSKNWRTALLSIGEIAYACGIGPLPLINHLGEDLALQHAWMRWIIGYWIKERGQGEWILSLPVTLPAIPAWPEIIRNLQTRGIGAVCTYGVKGVEGHVNGMLPDDWDPQRVKSRDPSRGMSMQPARPPWTRPKDQWGLAAIIEESNGWPDRPWAPEIWKEFARGKKAKKEAGSKMIGKRSNLIQDRPQIETIERNW